MSALPAPAPDRAAVIGELRRRLPLMESGPATGAGFSFGLPPLDRCLPGGRLASGALHEIAPATEGDAAAALGFLVALIGRMAPDGLILLVTAPGWAPLGRPYGHGLHQLGLDPGRLLLAEAGDDIEALWALEEALRSAAPAAVAGLIESGLDLKMSRRLHLAAGESGLPFLLLRGAGARQGSAAATRWRVGAAPAARDRFGVLSGWRWNLTLERCRNGRTGEWRMEFGDAYRFRLAAAMADPAISERAGPPPLSSSSFAGRS